MVSGIHNYIIWVVGAKNETTIATIPDNCGILFVHCGECKNGMVKVVKGNYLLRFSYFVFTQKMPTFAQCKMLAKAVCMARVFCSTYF